MSHLWGVAILGAEPTAVTRTLRRGSKGDDVRIVQRALTDAGFSLGSIDGDFGPKTDQAVRAFQKARGLAVDGVVGPATTAALGIRGTALPALPAAPQNSPAAPSAPAPTARPQAAAPSGRSVLPDGWVEPDWSFQPVPPIALKPTAPGQAQPVPQVPQVDPSESFLTKKVAGVPVWGVGLAAVGAGGLGFALLRKR